jgi:hypothetical protein
MRPSTVHHLRLGVHEAINRWFPPAPHTNASLPLALDFAHVQRVSQMIALRTPREHSCLAM